jgi:hypothetical protein
MDELISTLTIGELVQIYSGLHEMFVIIESAGG